MHESDLALISAAKAAATVSLEEFPAGNSMEPETSTITRLKPFSLGNLPICSKANASSEAL